jgi:TetR/AcrR family transcriptional regulator, tetracycline repressor protein
VQRVLVERLLGEFDLGGLNDRTRPWRQRLQSLAVDMRTRLLSHPGAVSLLLAAPMDGPHAMVLSERLLMVFADAGLAPEEATRACHLVLTYTLGSIALEAAELDQGQTPPPENKRIATRLTRFAAVPSDGLPRTAAAAATMARHISTEQYLWGLNRLCDGLSSQMVPTHPDIHETEAPTAVPD